MMQNKRSIDILAVVHGLYFCLTGLWPLIHMSSFLLVTGPKTDLWLVDTVGVLVLVIGLGLMAAGLRKQVAFPLSIIAMGSSLGLIFIDIIYVWREVILPIYLLDALVELILVTAWIIYLYKEKLWEIRYK